MKNKPSSSNVRREPVRHDYSEAYINSYQAIFPRFNFLKEKFEDAVRNEDPRVFSYRTNADYMVRNDKWGDEWVQTKGFSDVIAIRVSAQFVSSVQRTTYSDKQTQLLSAVNKDIQGFLIDTTGIDAAALLRDVEKAAIEAGLITQYDIDSVTLTARDRMRHGLSPSP